MSLRIYIKGTPKFSSPRRTTQALPFSPNFNSLYASKPSNRSKKGGYQPEDSKDHSVMQETNTLSMDPSHSFDDNSNASHFMKKKGIGQQTERFLNNKNEDQTDRFLKNEKEFRSQKEIQEAIKEFNEKLNSRANIPEKQLRKIIKESDNMILSLLQEVEQLTEMLTEKLRDNDILKSFTTIPTSTQDYRYRPGDDGRTDIEGFKRNESLLENVEASKIIQENKKMTEEVGKLNAELNEEVSLLREMASSSEQALQKERETHILLKAQAEELLTAYDNLVVRSKDKDKDIQRLEEELLDARVTAEKLRRAGAGSNIVFDDTKRILMDLQSPQDNFLNLKVRDEMNHTLSPFSKGISPTTGMWSHVKMESPSYLQMERPEMKELQKKYEETKNDNVRLMKMIEENQKVIKDLKNAFTELEKRNNMRFEEIKGFYESRGEGGLQESNMNIPKSSNRTETTNESLTKANTGVMNSFMSSKGIHSKRPSSDSVAKSKRSLIPMAICGKWV